MIIDLQGKVALVTGAGRGIGREIYNQLAQEGTIAVALDAKPEMVADVTQAIEANGWNGMARTCDVRDYAAIQAVVSEVVERYGRIDILVNNAGVGGGAPADEMTEETWDLVQEVNLKGTFLMCKAVIPVMKAQRSGRILNAASFAAVIPSLGGAAYASSKAAVQSLTRVLAGELGPWNITANCYAPGMIPTQLNHFAEQPAESQEKMLDMLSLRRWGDAADIAYLICFLASDFAGYITGTMVEITGGKFATQTPRGAYERAAQQGIYSFNPLSES